MVNIFCQKFSEHVEYILPHGESYLFRSQLKKNHITSQEVITPVTHDTPHANTIFRIKLNAGQINNGFVVFETMSMYTIIVVFLYSLVFYCIWSKLNYFRLMFFVRIISTISSTYHFYN